MFYVALVLGTLLGCVLSVSALAKSVDIHAFTKTIRAYHVFPTWSAPPLALVVLALEAALALALFLRAEPMLVGLATAGLIGVFLLAGTMAYLSGRDTDCGCFGTAHREGLSPKTLSRDGLLVAFALIVGAFGSGSPSTLDSLSMDSARDLAVVSASIVWLVLTSVAAANIVRARPRWRPAAHEHDHPVHLGDSSPASATIAIDLPD